MPYRQFSAISFIAHLITIENSRFHIELNTKPLQRKCATVSGSLTDYSKKNERRQLNVQIIKENIGMVKNQRETRQGWIVHNG